MATDLVDTLAALRPDADRVDIVLGHSLGSVVALVGISEHPSIARRIVLEDPPGPGLDYARMATEIRDNISAARRDPAQFARDIFVGPLAQLADNVRDAHVEGVAAADPTFVPKIVRTLAEIDVVALAARCALPTLIFLGRDKGTALGDGRSPSEDLSRFSALSGPERARFCSSFRHARVHELPSGHELHHMVFAEYVEVLADWLEDTKAVEEPNPAEA
jgi:pimeloyl-ACP methyl ester carboxylesterase